jgi:hypothetical protein
VLILVWLIADPRTPDLAAQVYRADLFGRAGMVIFDEHWYGGHQMPGYSLLFPPLGSLLGVRLLAALSVLASALIFERLLRSLYGRAALWGSVWFAAAAVGDIWSGRLSFALGVSFATAAGLALQRGRAAAAALLAAVCAAASPVAGLCLGIAGLTIAVDRRSPRALLALGVPAAAVVLALAALFPEGGWEPFPLRSFVVTALVGLAFLAALPAGERLLRTGGLLYLLACLLCLLIHSPIGSNVARYGVLLAGPLLLCARLGPEGPSEGDRGWAGGGGPGGPRAGGGGRARETLGPLAAAALLLTAAWVVWGPVRETIAVAGSPATSASYYVPVERFLESVTDGPVRVEVPLTRSHWEAALLAPSVSLARGWEKQLDTRYDDVLLRPGLTAAAYHAWLREQAVAYVALPDVPLDPSSAQEGRLIHAGLPYLRQVFRSAHWRIYGVIGSQPLLSGPGRLTSLGNDSFALLARAPGSFLARIRYTRYWTLTRGRGCVARAAGGWTEVRLSSSGPATVSARFSLGRALGRVASCPS